MANPGSAFSELMRIMDELREKCPWDKKQTIHSLRSMTIEETYELADAITMNDWRDIKEELGDLLLHIVFYTKIASEEGQFVMNDVLSGICKKLVDRHPHIYGDEQKRGLQKVESADDVKKNWEKLKLQEGKKSILSGLPASLPALVKAMRIQEKVKQVGFEWEHTHQVWNKIEEELSELKEAVASGYQDHIEEEFGDLLFSLVNYSRFIQVDAENALERTNKKFKHRFTQMEEAAALQGKSLQDMSLEEMDSLWNIIKTGKK